MLARRNDYNPLWRDLKSGESLEDLLLEIQITLFNKNERDNCDRRIKTKKKQSMNEEQRNEINKSEEKKMSAYNDEDPFEPKEHFVFLYCSIAAPM